MFAYKSTVNLTKCTTKSRTHDAYTVLLVLKLWLVVVVIVITTIKHQVFKSLYNLLQNQFWVKYSNFLKNFFHTEKKIRFQPTKRQGRSLIKLENFHMSCYEELTP